jgi:phospholipid/cholesterol/gamma-HCH transport system substrate-binding protein
VRLKNELAVGILFFVGISVLGYFTIVMKDEIFDSKDYYQYIADFPSINGLKKGERVKMFGVDVGSITGIGITGRMVRVNFRVYEDLTFYENYILKIRAESIMMGKHLQIDPGTPFTGEKKNAVVDTRKPLIGQNPVDVIAMVEDMLSENRADIRESVSNARALSKNLKEVTDKINKGEGTLGKLVTEDQTQGVKDLVQEVRDTVEDAREQAPVTSFIRSVLTFL